MTVAASHADFHATSSKASRDSFDRMALQIVLAREEPDPDASGATYEEMETPPQPQPGGGYARSVVQDALQRVLASDTFRHSQRHRTFLRYVVDAVLDGRHDGLKEVVIGLEVFGRQLNRYDPDRDSIVRVEVRRLRKKLQQYYVGEGAADTIEIRIPTGAYVPLFGVRRTEAPTSRKVPCFLVLPLQMPNGDDGQRGFAIGLVDQMIDRLGADAGLRVMAPISAAALREQVTEIAALRRDHGVDYVIDGSMTCLGSRVRYFAHLARTADGIRVWSGRFDVDTAAGQDLFDFQDRVVDAIFAAVTVEKEGA